MDEKIEDKSKESRKKHAIYYKSLSKVIKNIEKEIETEKDEHIIKHLKERIDAINLDKKRIQIMFPENIKEFEDEQTK